MVGQRHVEAVAYRDGLLHAYVSDLNRRPLPLRGQFGKATLHAESGDVLRALGRVSTPTGPGLGGRFDPFNADEVTIELDLIVDGEPLNVEFVLAVAAVPAPLRPLPRRCEAVANTTAAAGHPDLWCKMDLGRAVSAIDVAPNAGAFVVGAVDLPTTAWDLADGRRLARFARAPEVPALPGHSAHAQAPNAVRVRPPYGQETVVVVENRLLVYASATGKLRAELPAADGIVLDAGWFDGGDAILTFLAYRPQIFRVARDGTAHAAIADLGVNVVAIAVSDSGDRFAAATTDSHVVIASAHPTVPARPLARRNDRPLTRISALRFAGDLLLAVTRAGELQVWDVETGELLATADGLHALVSLAVRADGLVAAAGDADGNIHLFDLSELPTLTQRSVLALHQSTVTAIDWAQDRLVSGDEQGVVAVWQPSLAAPMAR